MGTLKLGVASVTFRNKTREEVVSICKNTGVDYIEWGGDIHVKTLDDAKKAKELCDKENIKICSYGSYYRTLKSDKAQWEEICRIASEMGADSIRVWLGEKDSEKFTDEEYSELVEEVKMMCGIAQKYNLRICPECHDNTFNNNTDSIIKLKNDVAEDNFKTYFQSRYFRPVYDMDRIERTFDFIENVHISYRDLVREQLLRKKDKMYIDRLLKKIISMEFKGIVLVEFVSGDSEKNFIKDIEKLKAY